MYFLEMTTADGKLHHSSYSRDFNTVDGAMQAGYEWLNHSMSLAARAELHSDREARYPLCVAIRHAKTGAIMGALTLPIVMIDPRALGE